MDTPLQGFAAPLPEFGMRNPEGGTDALARLARMDARQEAMEARLTEIEARTRLPERLTLAEASVRTGLKLAWLKLQVELRTLAHMQIGKTTYVKPADLEKCLERFTIEARASSAA